MKILEVPPDVRTAPNNDLNTLEAFKKNVGKIHVVKAVNRYGMLELELPNLDSIWIEPEYVKEVSARKK